MTITGESQSRLSELKKYAVTGDFFNQYKLSTGSATDGVNKSQTSLNTKPIKIVYYVDGIRYVDTIQVTGNSTVINAIANGERRTTFRFIGQGYDSPDFVNYPTIKNPDEHNLVEHPKIDSDVFIVRQSLSVFDKNYKLRDVRNLVQFRTYAGNNYFNIIDNT